jgi:hypothetical protein
MVFCKVCSKLLRMNNRSRIKLIIGIDFTYNYRCFLSDGIITNIYNIEWGKLVRDKNGKTIGVTLTPGTT